MGGALLAAGGNTLQEAQDNLAKQIRSADAEFHMQPASPYHFTVSEGFPLPPTLRGANVAVVPLRANLDWHGQTWPYVASVRVHA